MAAIRRMPAGTVVREGRHDPVPGMPEGVPVKVKVTVSPEDATIDVDLRDNLDCQPCGLNLTEATARTAGMMGVFTGLAAVVPPNAGSFRRLRVHLRENCIVGIPRHPTSCSAATTDLSELTAGLVALALGDLGEGFGLGQIGRAQPASMAVISGVDPRPPGGPFVNQLILAVTGGAGAPAADGWLTILGIGAAGFLFRDSVEIDEMKYPIVVHDQRILPDSEGAGRFRGSPGALVEFGPDRRLRARPDLPQRRHIQRLRRCSRRPAGSMCLAADALAGRDAVRRARCLRPGAAVAGREHRRAARAVGEGTGRRTSDRSPELPSTCAKAGSHARGPSTSTGCASTTTAPSIRMQPRRDVESSRGEARPARTAEGDSGRAGLHTGARLAIDPNRHADEPVVLVELEKVRRASCAPRSRRF